jgi:hypothetical protein
VYAHANAEVVYDFYKNILGRDSYDDRGAPVDVNIDLLVDRTNRELWWTRNAFWDASLQTIVFGSRYDPVLDVMGHEFTHAVIDYAVPQGGLYYAHESGGLEESYADIMGMFAENKNDGGRWTCGEDSSRVIRSFSNPAQYFQIEHYSKYNDNLDVHSSSGIFNFAAYKMMTDKRTASISANTWANVFYKSLFRLSCDARFIDGRGAVLSAAKNLGFNGTEQQAIKDAFDAVGITESKSVRIVLRWGEAPLDLDSHLVGPMGGSNKERFHVYFLQRDCYKGDETVSRVDLDHDDSTSYGPEIMTIRVFVAHEDYCFYVQDYTNRELAGSTALAKSGATVNVYRGASNTPIGSYSIDPSSVGTIWNVFRLTMDESENITLTPIDTYGSSATLN